MMRYEVAKDVLLPGAASSIRRTRMHGQDTGCGRRSMTYIKNVGVARVDNP